MKEEVKWWVGGLPGPEAAPQGPPAPPPPLLSKGLPMPYVVPQEKFGSVPGQDKNSGLSSWGLPQKTPADVAVLDGARDRSQDEADVMVKRPKSTGDCPGPHGETCQWRHWPTGEASQRTLTRAAKGQTCDCSGPCKKTKTQRNVAQGEHQQPPNKRRPVPDLGNQSL